MAVDHVKATDLTNDEASPRIAGKVGRNAPGVMRISSGSATALASSSADATYQLVRLPPEAIVKAIWFQSDAQGAGKFDLGCYYSDDLTPLAADAIDQDFFATVIDCAAAVVRTEVTNESTTYTIAKQQQQLWEALGLSTNPNRFIDIVATVKTTAVTTGTGVLGIDVYWTL